MAEHGEGRQQSGDLHEMSGQRLEQLVKDIYNHPEKITDVAPSQQRYLAQIIYQDSGYEFILNNISRFAPEVHNDIAVLLIEKESGRKVAYKLKQFSDLDARVAIDLAGLGQTHDVSLNLESFSNLTVEVAEALIRNEPQNSAATSYNVIEHRARFTGLDEAKLTELLLRYGKSAVIAWNIEQFPSVSHDELIGALARDCSEEEFSNCLQSVKFADSNVFTISEVIRRDHGKEVLRQATELKNLVPGHVKALVAQGYAKELLEKINAFHPERATGQDKILIDFLIDDSVPRKIKESREVARYLEKHAAANSHETVWDAEAGRPVKPEDLNKEEESSYELDAGALRARVTTGVPPLVYAWHKMERGAPEQATEKELLHSWSEARIEGADWDIVDAFEKLRERVGDKIVLQYLGRADLSDHDALYFFEDAVHIQENAGLTAEEFGKNILVQVGRDGASYDEGSAHHRFAAVSKELSAVNVPEVLERARGYGNIKKMQELVDEIGKENFASSWKTLKKTYELVQLLGRTEILNELNAEALDPKMRAYVEQLAFHPNISTEAVITFWKEPAQFLDVDDHHTQDRINEVKKPSNYLSLPFLGLNAEDLRDAYVSGEMDALQTLPPMERTYTLGAPENEDLTRPETVHAFLRRALGQERKGVKGEGKNPKKIFDALRTFCSAQKCHLPDLLDPEKGRAMVEALPPDAVEWLKQIAFDKEIGMKQPKNAGETYRIRIGDKSDPSMAVAGNDTASCMPFGSGKNNVYMFNPNCTQLVLERQLKDGSWRTAAQSVMTIDHVASQPTPELIKKYQETGGHLGDLISEEDLLRTPVVTCDNIEVAKNEEGERTRFVREAYERYFKEYLAAHAGVLGVDPTRVAIGAGYTPDNLGFAKVDNTFVPQAPMGYSDNVHEKAFVIETGLAPLETKPQQGMLPLTTRDALAVAMLEGKAYKDNESLLMNLHHMQNAIIGMEIANAHFQRPNLSSVYRDAKGVPRGYMLAYEGVNGGQPEVYIDDLASDRTNRMAGGRLINQFFESYLRNYGTEQRPFIPIFTNARESTSYPILKANVERLAERAGLIAEMVEVGTHHRGEDTFHDLRIHIARTPEELEAQKVEYAGTTAAADASDEDW